ncbi:hypothetical protein MRB53_035962 [Persea americana]|uniref:Uncharacterized protein n=1 Tax=Persea americana TaxID=3435 RepID=A0ACC2K671_PERAE|nr:hypothetical protein MRB53_035962 [Persea americana]
MDVAAILRIPLSRQYGPDSRIWYFTSNGSYTVKSSYRLIMERLSVAPALHVNGPWVKLWRLSIPPRMQRNSKLWSNSILQVSHVVQLGVDLVVAWKHAQAHVDRPSSNLHNTQSLSWQKQPAGFFKCNANAALFPSESSMGVGMVLRNDTASFIQCSTMVLAGNFSPKVAEAIGFREFVKHQANGVAHALARASYMHASPCTWQVPPVFVRALLSVDETSFEQ